MQKVQRSSLKYATNKIVYYDMSALSSGRNKIFNCAAHIHTHTHSYRENITYSLYFTRCLCPPVPKINKERNIKCSPHSAAIHTHTDTHRHIQTLSHTHAQSLSEGRMEILAAISSTAFAPRRCLILCLRANLFVFQRWARYKRYLQNEWEDIWGSPWFIKWRKSRHIKLSLLLLSITMHLVF